MPSGTTRDPNEKKKMIMAIGLGVLAIIALWWTFIGFGSSAKPSRPAQQQRAGAVPSSAPPRAVAQADQGQNPVDVNQDAQYLQPIVMSGQPAGVPEPNRNVFAFYIPPKPTPVQVVVPSPSPTPPPPLELSAVSPANVYAHTDDFTLEVTGDKFTPAVHIIVDNRELPTRFVSAHQLSAVVPAAVIANPGQRTVSVRNNDGQLYSKQVTFNVSAPPVPNYSYIGILAKKKSIGDTAYLLDKSTKEILSVQRGDVVGGRFRVSSISDKELIVVDVNLKIKHQIQMSTEGDKGGAFPQGRPTPRVAAEDDEP